MKMICEQRRNTRSLSTTARSALFIGTFLLSGTAVFAQTTSPRPNDIFAINAGGAAIDGWNSDSNFLNGVTFVNNSQQVSLAGLPQDDAPSQVYQDAREGSAFSYIFTNLQPNTTFQVTLHFAELFFTAPRQREFNISINGTSVATNFDIVANAGGPFRGTTMAYFVRSDAQGGVEIDFTSGAIDQPSVNAVELASLLGG